MTRVGPMVLFFVMLAGVVFPANHPRSHPSRSLTASSAVVGAMGATVAVNAVQAISRPRPMPVRYDFRARAIKDDFPAAALLAYQRRLNPKYPMTAVRQCGVFALWRTDSNMDRPVYTMAIRLYAAAGRPRAGLPSADLDNAARRAHLRVDHIPAVGSVGILERGFHGASKATGHSFYVARVDTIHHRLQLEEYNGVRKLAYSTRVVPWSYASEYVHFRP